MSITNYTNINNIAGIKNQIRNGKTFSAMSQNAWTLGNSAIFNVSDAGFSNFANELSEFRLKQEDGATWTDWHVATGDVITATGSVVTVDEDVIPDEFDGDVLIIELKVAEGYVRLATANTWNQYNTAIKAPLYTTNIVGATPITQNGNHTFTIQSLLASGALNNYIGIDEETSITLNIQVPTAGAAVIDTATIDNLAYSSASLSGSNYTLNLTGDLEVTFSSYGTVDADIDRSNLPTSLTLPKLTINTTPTISGSESQYADFSATNNGFVQSGTTAITLNCYTGALDA